MKEEEMMKKELLNTLKISFAIIFGWVRIDGKKVEHEGFDEDRDFSYWSDDSLSDFVKDCVFWQDTNSDRATEDIDDVLDFIEDDHEVIFDEWKKKYIMI